MRTNCNTIVLLGEQIHSRCSSLRYEMHQLGEGYTISGRRIEVCYFIRERGIDAQTRGCRGNEQWGVFIVRHPRYISAELSIADKPSSVKSHTRVIFLFWQKNLAAGAMPRAKHLTAVERVWYVMDPCGGTTSTFTYFLICIADFGLVSVLDFDRIIDFVHFAIFNVLVGLAAICHARAMLTNPGGLLPCVSDR
jgi:hypothetical protein